MRILIILYLACVISLTINLKVVTGEDGKVSPKLDFEDSQEERNISQHSPASSSSSSTISGTSSNSKQSPKIEGVRVTVDTGKIKKSTDSGSKESVEIIESKNKKKVEIHTDITVEISDGNDSNGTSIEQVDKGENDASVPIFKGRRPATHKPPKPYDPRIGPWMPPSSSHPSYGRDGVIYTHQVYPNAPPLYPKTNDEGIYRNIDRWGNYIPVTRVWTTQRPYYPIPVRSYESGSSVDTRNYYQQPYVYSTERSTTQWKPCYCIPGVHRGGTVIGLKDNNIHRRSFTSEISKSKSVNDKLDSPFSN